MIEYIKGTVSSLTPTAVVLDNHGVGYLIVEDILAAFSAVGLRARLREL